MAKKCLNHRLHANPWLALISMSTSVPEALPCKLDITRHSPSILYLFWVCIFTVISPWECSLKILNPGVYGNVHLRKKGFVSKWSYVNYTNLWVTITLFFNFSSKLFVWLFFLLLLFLFLLLLLLLLFHYYLLHI